MQKSNTILFLSNVIYIVICKYIKSRICTRTNKLEDTQNARALIHTPLYKNMPKQGKHQYFDYNIACKCFRTQIQMPTRKRKKSAQALSSHTQLFQYKPNGDICYEILRYFVFFFLSGSQVSWPSHSATISVPSTHSSPPFPISVFCTLALIPSTFLSSLSCNARCPRWAEVTFCPNHADDSSRKRQVSWGCSLISWCIRKWEPDRWSPTCTRCSD